MENVATDYLVRLGMGREGFIQLTAKTDGDLVYLSEVNMHYLQLFDGTCVMSVNRPSTNSWIALNKVKTTRTHQISRLLHRLEDVDEPVSDHLHLGLALLASVRTSTCRSAAHAPGFFFTLKNNNSALFRQPKSFLVLPSATISSHFKKKGCSL